MEIATLEHLAKECVKTKKIKQMVSDLVEEIYEFGSGNEELWGKDWKEAQIAYQENVSNLIADMIYNGYQFEDKEQQ